MPFKSDSQRRYLWAKKPKVAKEFAAKTTNGMQLPEHVSNSKVLRKMAKKRY